MRETVPAGRRAKTSPVAVARCACGTVKMEIDYPAFWAWHDHSESGRRTHGCAYATYIGTWRKRFRVVKGAKHVRRYEDRQAGATRTFCGTCGTPLTLERARAQMGEYSARAFRNAHRPRAALSSRAGRSPGMGIPWREAFAAQGLSRRDVGAPGAKETAAGQQFRREPAHGFRAAGVISSSSVGL